MSRQLIESWFCPISWCDEMSGQEPYSHTRTGRKISGQNTSAVTVFVKVVVILFRPGILYFWVWTLPSSTLIEQDYVQCSSDGNSLTVTQIRGMCCILISHKKGRLSFWICGVLTSESIHTTAKSSSLHSSWFLPSPETKPTYHCCGQCFTIMILD